MVNGVQRGGGKRVAAPSGPTPRPTSHAAARAKRRADVPTRLTAVEIWSARIADSRVGRSRGLQMMVGAGVLVVGGAIAWGVDRTVGGEGTARDPQAAATSTPNAAGSPSANSSTAPSDDASSAPASKSPAGLEGSPLPKAQDPLRTRDRAKKKVVARGAGTFSVVPLVSRLAPDPDAETYTVEVEDGINIDPEVVTATVDAVLADARGWRSKGHTLARTDEEPDFRIVVASPKTTDDLCAPLETEGRVSCHNPEGNVVLNARRWSDGIPDYEKDLVLYRTYLINHEVGHHLGYQHESCGGAGRPAPVMMQQTYGLKGCAQNVWPL